MHMSVAHENDETSTRGKKVWVAFPQIYVLMCGLQKKWQSKLFLELGGGEATCPDTGLYSINLFKQRNPYGRRYAATLITSFVLG